MDTVLEKHKLLNVIQKETENLNRFITTKEIELVIEIFPQRKTQAHMTLLVNYIKYLKK